MDTDLREQQEQEFTAEDHVEECNASTYMEVQVHGRLTWPHFLVKQGMDEELDAAAQSWRRYCRFRVIAAETFLFHQNTLDRHDRAAVKSLAESIRPVVERGGLDVNAQVECASYRLVFVVPFSFDKTLVKLVTYTDEGQSDGNQLQCAICLADFACGEEAALLPCGHRFHADCAKQWLSTEFKCPMCRHDIMREGAASSTSVAPTDDEVEHPDVTAESASHLAKPEHDEDTVIVVLSAATTEAVVPSRLSEGGEVDLHSVPHENAHEIVTTKETPRWQPSFEMKIKMKETPRHISIDMAAS